MADIIVQGKTYTNVPAVNFRKVGGGFATFSEGGGEHITVNPLSVNANGTYTAPEGTAYSPVTVDVQNLIPIVMRPDAEKVATYSYDKHIVGDEGIEIPEYKTSATVLKASENLTPTYSVDLVNYNYYVVERMLTIPEYSVTTTAKGRVEYTFAAAGYELSPIEANTVHGLLNPSLNVTSRSIAFFNTGNNAKIVYYTNGTALGLYNSAAYATYQTVTAPSISGSTVTLKSPAFGVRGHTTYFTSTYMNALTDIRYQYVIEVWRSQKGNLSFDGWTLQNNALSVIGCVDGNTNTLR